MSRDEKILAEFYRRKGNVSFQELGERFGVSIQTISRAITRARAKDKHNRLIR